MAGQGGDPDTFSHIPSLAAFLSHLPGERVMYTTTTKDFLYGAIYLNNRGSMHLTVYIHPLKHSIILKPICTHMHVHAHAHTHT